MTQGGAPRAALLASGDELLEGAQDSNSAWLARELSARGWQVTRVSVLGDDEQALSRELAALASGHAALIVTGGLGPTQDDVTRQAAARAAGVALDCDQAVIAQLRALATRRGRPFAASNHRQALFPRGAQVLPNALGTAPGFALQLGGCLLCALPGPPREMQPMFLEQVAALLERHRPGGAALALQDFFLTGLTESAFADLCSDWMARDAQPLLGVTAGRGVLSVRLRARAESEKAARALLEPRAAQFRERFAQWIFSERQADLAQVLGAELIARGISVALAESCTGGLIASRLTGVPGISAVLPCAWVTYSNAAKTAELGVEPALLARCGAVSSEVAVALAQGAARRAGARVALSTTGIAGPGGGTAAKPVGLVWLGLSVDGRAWAEERRFAGLGRQQVRALAANAGLDLLRRALQSAR